MIAIDGMGGDFAPDVVVQGTLQCVKTMNIPVCLCGPEALLRGKLDALDSGWEKYPITLVDADQVVEMGEEPVQAVRSKPNSSLVKAVTCVKEGTCQAVISAGNSGAVMAAGLFLVGRCQGVERPALVGILPTVSGFVVTLDLGANADCKAKHLYQFACLGAQYARDVLSIESPRIGLLSNGEEPGKGSLLTKEAYKLCLKADFDFVGNIEPAHLFQGRVDVVVADGFTGNILLKTFEATSQMLRKSIPSPVEDESQGETIRFGKEGGALLLGIKRPVIVVHGNAQAKNIEQAIRFAYDVTKKIDLKKYCLSVEGRESDYVSRN